MSSLVAVFKHGPMSSKRTKGWPGWGVYSQMPMFALGGEAENIHLHGVFRILTRAEIPRHPTPC